MAVLTGLLLAVSLVIKPEFVISSDQMKYLVAAKNLADGNGAHDMGDPRGTFKTFRIGYTFFLASLIRVFGLSEWLVVAVNYIVFFSFVVLIYFLGLRLFGWLAGTLGAMFLISVPEVIAYGPRNLDALWPLLAIISTLLLLSRSERPYADAVNGALAGIVAAYAFLVKETSIFFLPVPAVMFMLGVRPPNIWRVIWFYSGTAVVAIFWAGCGYFILGLAAESIWTGSDTAVLANLGTGWDYIASLAGGLAKYFHNPEGKRQAFVFTRLPLAGAMVIAFVWSLWLAIKGNLSHRALLAVFVAFLPLSALAGALHLRFHQNFLFLVILCLILGAGFAALIQAMTTRFPNLKKKGNVATLVLLTGTGMLFNLLNTGSTKLAMEHFELTSKGSGLDIVYSGHKNLNALNTLPGGVVIAGDYTGEFNRAVFLFGKGRESSPLPFQRYTPGDIVPPGAQAVVSRVFKDPTKRDDTLFLFDGDAFMKSLEESGAKYVAIPGGLAAVAKWIEDNVGIERLMTFPRRNEPADILIFLPKTRKPVGQPADARKIYISRATFDMMERIKQESQPAYDELVDLMLRRGLKLDEGAISEILEGKMQGLRHIMVWPQPF
ncbi:MAG: glycosyltransferase family 39 protein [Nitrospinae bacterium]|nr:glycosyltransferase family 39 protein [Nitrospinota bacterium]MBF0634013.1 glycosyltransferase family 39 protein [Nitrospinota bacterium]